MKDPNRLCLGCMSEWGQSDVPCSVCGFVEKTYDKPPRWLPLRHILNGKYMIGKVIGEGGFGITYLGWDLNLQIRVAIKEYFPIGLATRETGRGNGTTISALPGVRQENYKQGLEKFMTEAKNLSKFYNLHGIVAVKDFFFENETAYMVMEYVDGITLGKYLKEHGGQISEQEVLQLFHPVMESLKVMHQSGIIHRDISPDNIMMTKEGQMKLIDFGAARFAGGDNERSLTIILKHGYAPAEQYQSHGNQGPWTDVYAICATMYRMITGKVPPSAMDRLHQDTLEEFEQLGCRVSTKTAYALIDKGLGIKVEDRYQNMDELIQGLYGIDQKKVRRIKKVQNQKKTVGIAAVACVVCLTICGLILGISTLNRNSQSANSGHTDNLLTGNMQLEDAQTGTGQNENDSVGSQNGSNEDSQNVSVTPQELIPVSEEELKILMAQTEQAENRISADSYHLVYLRDDGTVAANGNDYYGNLKVTNWKKIKAIATGDYHTVGVKEDGTAVAIGDISYGRCAVETWKGIVKVAVGNNHTIGLKENGTVSGVGRNVENQCEVTTWTDIVDIAAGNKHSLGLKSDGTVVAVGNDLLGQCRVEEWTDIVKIYANDNVSVGLKSDGTVVMTGEIHSQYQEACEWEQVIAIQLGKDYIAGLLSNKTVVITGLNIETKEKVKSWSDISAIAAADETLFGKKSDGSIVRTTNTYGTAKKDELTDLKKVVNGGGYLVGLKKDGSVVSWGVSGKNFGQAEVSEWSDISDIGASEYGIIGIKEDGSVVVVGEKYKEAESWNGIESISIGIDSAIGIKADGSYEAVGDIYGHEGLEDWNNISKAVIESGGTRMAALKNDRTIIGNDFVDESITSAIDIAINRHSVAVVMDDGTVKLLGEVGEYSTVYSWREVVQVAIGKNHIIGLKSDGTLYACGLNTNGQCNISEWTDVVYISAGDYFTLGIKSDGSLLIAGKLKGEY